MQEPYEDEYESAPTEDGVRGSLSAMTVDELRDLADEHGIDISGLKAKPDLVDAITLYPGIATILGMEEPSEAEAPPVEEAPPEEVGGMEPEAEAEEPTDTEESSSPGLTDQLKQAARTKVDFSVLQDFLTETVSRFKERSYDASLVTARDSISKVQEKMEDYIASCWAFAIVSAQRILEPSASNSRAAKQARARLREAEEAFQSGAFRKAGETLNALTEASRNLYEYEMEKARDRVAAQEKALQNIQAMGGDVSAALTMLRRAAEALNDNDRAHYLDLIDEADRLVDDAREGRIAEIKDAVESVESMIGETEAIGADVGQAHQLLEKVKGAVDSDDFVVASDLVSEAEQVVLEIQKSHIDKVSLMQERQVQKVKELITKVKPLIDRARSEGFQANEALQDLKGAAAAVNAGDYVNALIMAKRSQAAVKSFQRQSAAANIEPAPPEGEEGLAPDSGSVVAERACIHCGSENIEIGSKGRARCFDCGKKWKVA